MQKMIRNNVERIVSEDRVSFWEKKGFRKVAPVQPKQALDFEGESSDLGDEKKNLEFENQEEGVHAEEGQEFIGKPEQELEEMTMEELKVYAKEVGVQGYSNMNKATLIEVIKDHQ